MRQLVDDCNASETLIHANTRACVCTLTGAFRPERGDEPGLGCAGCGYAREQNDARVRMLQGQQVLEDAAKSIHPVQCGALELTGRSTGATGTDSYVNSWL